MTVVSYLWQLCGHARHDLERAMAMPRTILLTIGRLPKALDLARSFAARGDRVLVADPFRWHLLRVSNTISKTYLVPAPASDRVAYLEAIRRIVLAERVDLIVPVSEETMYVAALRDVLPPGVSMFAMPQDVILDLHNKQSFVATAARLGLDAPDTANISDARASAIATSGDYVIKPVFSCSGRGVSVHRAGEPIAQRDANEPVIVQRKIDGALYSTFTIAHDGQPRVTVVYRAAVMSGTVAVCFERVADQTAIERWVSTFVERMNYTGFVSFDFIVDGRGRAHAIECNPRVTSGVHFIEMRGLSAAIIDESASGAAMLRPNRLMQQLYPCLTETQKSFFNRDLFRRNLKCLFRARDVTWSARDPLPLLLMPVTASQIIARAIKKRQSFGEASTFDISWQPPPAA